jgi:hypothetical protein
LFSRNLKVKIYKTIILPFVLYGYGTWSITLREEHRLRVFENRVLRRIFGPKRDEVMGEWRKLHNGELHNVYSSPCIIRQIKSRREVGGACSTHGRKKKYNILIRKPKTKGHDPEMRACKRLTNYVAPETEGSSPHTQQPAKVPILSQANPLPPPDYLPKIHPNPILPSASWPSKWAFSFRLSHQNPVHVSPLSHA